MLVKRTERKTQKRGRGIPDAPFRQILNTLLSILITGCRWCDVPRGSQWASKSATHRWLQRWQADSTLSSYAGISSETTDRSRIRETIFRAVSGLSSTI